MSDYQQKLLTAYPQIEKKWDEDIIPLLEEYISIPNKSPMFDADWEKNGYMAKAMDLIKNWCEKQPIKDMSIELIQDEGRTPLMLIDIPGQGDDSILLYGHMDKQPEMVGWDEDLGPWKPVIKDNKLYGRGGADDGYSAFCALTAIATLQQENIPHSRCVLLIEASEESGSCDLPHYLQELKPRIGTPSLVITLDSDCGNYEQMWSTTSLRGLAGGELTVEMLSEGIHSGFGSGTVPSTFSVLRKLLDRIENTSTGDVIVEELHTDIPKQRLEQAQAAAAALGTAFYTELPFVGNAQPVSTDVCELILNRTWRPALSVVGLDGLPPLANAGNVTVPKLTVKLSMRLPPVVDAESAATALKNTLETNPPFGANVTFHCEEAATGWHAPDLAPWLEKANEIASQLFYEKPAAYLGGGGSIPFMGMLGDMFPQAQFLITGVLGPKSNAHGPNEFLHIPMVKKLTGAVAAVIAEEFLKET